MKRREFITLLGGAVAAWPLAAGAQQPPGKLPRVGSISNFPNENFEAFIEGLREAGRVDGQNMQLETRYHRGALAGIDQLASELVALKCDVILAAAPYAIQAVMNATSTIPIVGIDLESDPVARGWVKSLARPEGNFTGFFLDIPEGQTDRTPQGSRADSCASGSSLGCDNRHSAVPRDADGGTPFGSHA